MAESVQAIAPYALAIGSLVISLVWAAISLRRRWKGLSRSFDSVNETMQVLSSDISRLPWIEGMIARSEVKALKGVPTEDNSTTNLYRAVLTYEYAIDGKKYTGTSDTYEYAPGDSEFAADVVVKYPAGTRVRVYFHREHPQISYLGIEEIYRQVGKLSDELRDAGVWP